MNPAPAPPSKAVFSQRIPCGFQVLSEQIRPWGHKTEEKIKETNVYKAAAVIQPHFCCSSVGAHSSNDAGAKDQALHDLGQAQSPSAPAAGACRGEKRKGDVKGFTCKPNGHLDCTNYLCLFCTRGAAVPLCHRIIVTPRTTLCPLPSTPPDFPFSNPKGDYLATFIADKDLSSTPLTPKGTPAPLGAVDKLWLGDWAVLGGRM